MVFCLEERSPRPWRRDLRAGRDTTTMAAAISVMERTSVEVSKN